MEGFQVYPYRIQNVWLEIWCKIPDNTKLVIAHLYLYFQISLDKFHWFLWWFKFWKHLKYSKSKPLQLKEWFACEASICRILRPTLASTLWRESTRRREIKPWLFSINFFIQSNYDKAPGSCSRVALTLIDSVNKGSAGLSFTLETSLVSTGTPSQSYFDIDVKLPFMFARLPNKIVSN